MSRNDSEANWNRRTDRQTDGQDHILSQADAMTNKSRQEDVATFLVACHRDSPGRVICHGRHGPCVIIIWRISAERIYHNISLW